MRAGSNQPIWPSIAEHGSKTTSYFSDIGTAILRIYVWGGKYINILLKTTMNKIKIMQILYVLEPGGAEQVVLNLATTFNNKRFETVVVGFKDGLLLRVLQEKGVRTYVIGKNYKIDFPFIIRLIRIIRHEKPHLIQTHNFSANLWGGMVAKFFTRTASIATLHTTTRCRLIDRLAYRFIALLADRTVAVSQKVRDAYMESSNLAKKKILLIYNGVDVFGGGIQARYKNELKRSLGLESGTKVVTAVGRLERPKGYEYLLRAAQEVLRSHVDTRFLIVGDGSLRYQLEQTVRSMGIDSKVQFMGYREDVPLILSVSDVSVISSVREGFSIALIEHMAMAKPIVATDVGGNREAISDGVNGIIVPPADPHALAEGIERVFEDRDLAYRIGCEARRVYEQKFTQEKMIQHYESLYFWFLKLEPHLHQ